MKLTDRKFIVVDVETTGLSPQRDKLHGIGIGWEEDKCEYFPAWNVPLHVRAALANPKIDKVGHRVRFDLKFLLAAGFKIKGQIWCTKILAHLLDENSGTGLKELSEKFLGSWAIDAKRELDAAIAGAGLKSLDQLHKLDLEDAAHPYLDVIGKYCAEDCNNTLKLWFLLTEKAEKASALMKEHLGSKKTIIDYYIEESMPTERVLLKMEMAGINTNPEAMNEIKQEFTDRSAGLRERLDQCSESARSAVERHLFGLAVDKRKSPAGKAKVEKRSEKYGTLFNWDSNQHVGKLLYEQANLQANFIQRTGSGQYDTSEIYLRYIQQNCNIPQLSELLKTFADYKKTQKTLNTYIGGDKGIVSHVQGGRIYAEYDPFIVTGRLSSCRPNMQNLPRGSRIKRFFVPEGDCVYAYFDYSQIELRVAAHLSQDEVMLELFKTNADPHRALAAKIFGIEESQVTDEQRQVGKTCNFLLIFKGSPWRLQQELKDKNGLEYTIEDCKVFVDGYFDLYKGYGSYLDGQLQFMRRYHRVVSETGRVRRLPDIVYGSYLDWRSRTFTGPPSLTERLVSPAETPAPAEIFERASKKFSHAKKQGFNMPIQGLAASICKRALFELAKRGFHISTTVHDSVVIQLPKSELGRVQEIREIMETAYPLSVPLKVDVKILNSLDEKDRYEPEELKKFAKT